jgi:hypothetical protein
MNTRWTFTKLISAATGRTVKEVERRHEHERWQVTVALMLGIHRTGV